MAATVKNSLKFFSEMLQGQHDLVTDNLNIALMETAFTFNEETHSTWADCSASEITAGNGYTAGGQALSNVNVTINTAEKRIEFDADNPTWTASGGAIAQTGSAILYNDSHTNKTVIAGIQFSAAYDTPDTKIFQLNFANGIRFFENMT